MKSNVYLSIVLVGFTLPVYSQTQVTLSVGNPISLRSTALFKGAQTPLFQVSNLAPTSLRIILLISPILNGNIPVNPTVILPNSKWLEIEAEQLQNPPNLNGIGIKQDIPKINTFVTGSQGHNGKEEIMLSLGFPKDDSIFKSNTLNYLNKQIAGSSDLRLKGLVQSHLPGIIEGFRPLYFQDRIGVFAILLMSLVRIQIKLSFLACLQLR